MRDRNCHRSSGKLARDDEEDDEDTRHVESRKFSEQVAVETEALSINREVREGGMTKGGNKLCSRQGAFGGEKGEGVTGPE